MKNLKTSLISVVTLISLVGSPVVSLASEPAVGNPDARGAVKKELDDLKAARDAFKDARKDESDKRAMEMKEKKAEVKKDLEAKRMEAEKRKEAHRKEVLLRLIDVQVKHFKNIQERVARMPNIDETLKARLKTEIDKVLSDLAALKTKVEAATTAEELKTLAKQIQENLKQKREIVKKIVDAIVAAHLQNAVDRADERIKTAEAKIAELKTAGKDVTSLESLLATAKAKLDAAKASLSKDSLEEAKDALKDLYEALKDLSKKTTD